MGVYDSTGANPIRNLTPAPKVKQPRRKSPVGAKRKTTTKKGK